MYERKQLNTFSCALYRISNYSFSRDLWMDSIHLIAIELCVFHVWLHCITTCQWHMLPIRGAPFCD